MAFSGLALDGRAEADAGAGVDALTDHLIQAGESTTADKQDLGGINLQELLLRMFAPTLRRNRGDGAFNQLQQRLLHAFTRDVTRDRRVVGLAGNLIDFIDINDAALRFLHVIVTFLQQLLDNIFHVLTHVTGFGQRGGVGHGERHVQEARQRFRQQSFTAAGRADQQDVALAQLDTVAGIAVAQAFVVVVHRNRQHFLRLLLADDVVIQVVANFVRRRQCTALTMRGNFFNLFANNVVTQIDTFIADIH